MIWLLEKARSCRVRSAARAAAPEISSRDTRKGSAAGRSSSTRAAFPRYGAEHVVEVVRHAAGEPPDGLHLLGVPVLLLELGLLLLGTLPLGDVEGDVRQEPRLAGGRLLDGEGQGMHVGELAGLQVPVLQVPFPRLAAHQRRQQVGLDELCQVLGDDLHDVRVLELFWIDPEHLGAELVQEDHPAVQVGDVDQLSAVLHHGDELLQLLFGPLLLRDVAGHAQDEARVAIGPLDELRVVAREDRRAVLAGLLCLENDAVPGPIVAGLDELQPLGEERLAMLRDSGTMASLKGWAKTSSTV